MPSADARQALALALEHGLEYTALRDFVPDARLFAYVPASLAAREGVVPIILIGDTLKVAASRLDPDLSLVSSRFPYMTLSMVVAPATEIAAALTRVPGHR